MRFGRATSSPPQFGHTDDISSEHATQKVHSKLQMRASPASSSAASQRSQVVLISSMDGRYRPPSRGQPLLAGSVGTLAVSAARGT